jgi:tetratricopeptide (TPR) repeat protein
MKPKKPMPASPAGRARSLVLAAAIVMILGVAAFFWRRHGETRPLPSVDLSKVDPKVAATVRQHLEDVRHRPRSADSWGWLGALLWAYDFRPAARECLVQAERLDPGNPHWPYYHALSLIIATPNQAIPLLEQTVRLCGSSPEAPRFRLAHLLAEQGRWDEARRQYEALLADHADFTPARLLAARDAQRRGELDAAIDLARKCVDDPRTARSAWILISNVSRQKGDTSTATQAARRVASAPPEEAIADQFHAEATLRRGDPRALSEQAHPLLAAGHLNHAAALIDRLQREHPDFADTWLLAGRLEFLRKNLLPAEQFLRKHVEMNPRSAQGVFQLGMVLLAREQWTNAAATFGTAIELKPDFGPAYFNRGLALAHANDGRAAIAAFEQSLRQNPERVESYLYLADLHLRFGERDAALTVLDQAQSLSPNDPRIKSLRERVAGKKVP